MSEENTYNYVRGPLYLAERDDDGNPLALKDMGDTVDAEITIETEFIDNYNNRGKFSSQDAHVAHKGTGKVKLSLKKKSVDILSMALYGEAVTETGGAFSASASTTLPTGIVAGDKWAVPQGKANLSAITIVDSNGTPATLVEGTHYSVDKMGGIITFITVSGKTQPFKVSGTEVAGQVQVPILTRRSQEFYCILPGIDLLDDDKGVRVDLYRVAFGPASKFMLKGSGNDPNVWEIEGILLADPQRSPDSTLGQYGAYRLLE